jgi:hypothetical protein
MRLAINGESTKMNCKYGQHSWNLTKKPIICKVCGEIIKEPAREHTSSLSYTDDTYDF